MSVPSMGKIIMILMLLTIASCTTFPSPAQGPTQLPSAYVLTATSQPNMANPASGYCIAQGNRLEIRTAADGSQSGVCIFPDGSECDEWTYFRGECGSHSSITETAVIPTPRFIPASQVVIPQTVLLPAGAIIDPSGDRMKPTQSMIFYNRDGLTLGELLTPNALAVHAAGHYQGLLNFPLVFDASAPDGQKYSIDLNSGSSSTYPGGQVSRLVSMQDEALVSGLVGVPGEPLIFYIVFQAAGTVQSQFVLSMVDSLQSATPLLALGSQESRYWKPVAIQMKDGAPSGLWFTREPWGIGGDIVFPYYEGVSFYDLASKTVNIVLPPEAQFSSLSDDQTWVAFSVRKGQGSEFYIQKLTGDTPLMLPSLPESDRGSGDSLFSPSDKYIAWREAQGSIADNNFHQTIRVASTDGQMIADFKDVPFYKTAGIENTSAEIKPVGWLDEENILVQVTLMEKFSAGKVIKLNVSTGEMSLFAEGFYSGRFYP